MVNFNTCYPACIAYSQEFVLYTMCTITTKAESICVHHLKQKQFGSETVPGSVPARFGFRNLGIGVG